MKTSLYAILIMTALLVSACGAPIAPANGEIPASPPAPNPSQDSADQVLVIWESGGADCTTAVMTLQGFSYGRCGDSLTQVTPDLTSHTSRLGELSNRFGSFTAETAAGSLIFKGLGAAVPTEAEQRAMAEWASLLFQVAESGRAGAAWGMAFAWHREGGTGAFCDDVVVYLTGWVTASDCKGYSVQGDLTASQLDRVYGWVDRLAVVDHTQTFPETADGFQMTLALAGKGGDAADEETIQEIFEFAAMLYTELGYIAEAGADVEQARDILENYLVALHDGDYARAANLYGGDTELLQAWNPDVGNDIPTLLGLACTQNGVQCLLPRAITYRAPDEDGGYHFYVEFNNDDQTLFRQGPCCGETDGPTLSQFSFYVEESPDGLVVTDLPPYVP